MSKTKRVLPADVYDAFELSAFAHGGIGGGKAFDYLGHPVCILGHRDHICGSLPGRNAVDRALESAGLGIDLNDEHTPLDGSRISWAEYCRRLNIVRGSAD